MAGMFIMRMFIYLGLRIMTVPVHPMIHVPHYRLLVFAMPGVILVVVVMFVIHNYHFMRIAILSVQLAIFLFSLIYSVYKTKSDKKPKQIISAIVGALLLVYILYTCNSDN